MIKDEVEDLKETLESLFVDGCDWSTLTIQHNGGRIEEMKALLDGYSERTMVCYHRADWTDFSVNRNLLLDSAKETSDDLTVLLDAGEIANDFCILFYPRNNYILGADKIEGYVMPLVNVDNGTRGNVTISRRIAIVRTHSKVRYMYPIHEELVITHLCPSIAIKGGIIHLAITRKPGDSHDRIRNSDIPLLKSRLEKEWSMHDAAYLRQSYMAIGMYREAIVAANAIVDRMGEDTYDNNVYTSLLTIAECMQRLKAPPRVVITGFIRAKEMSDKVGTDILPTIMVIQYLFELGDFKRALELIPCLKGQQEGPSPGCPYSTCHRKGVYDIMMKIASDAVKA